MTDQEIDQAVSNFRPLADWWAGRIQWSEEDHEDLVQEGLYWLLRTLQGYQKSGKPIRDLSSVANACLSSAMKWSYRTNYVNTPDVYHQRAEGKIHKVPFQKPKNTGTERDLDDDPEENFIQMVEADKIPQIAVDGAAEYFGEIWTQEYIAEVGRVLGEVAQKIVRNLLVPGSEVIAVAMEEMAMKAERMRTGERGANGGNLTGHSTLRITNEQIRKVTHLTEGQWQKELGGIKKFTRQWLDQESLGGYSRNSLVS